MSTNRCIMILAILLLALPLAFPQGYGYGYSSSSSGGGDSYTKPKVNVDVQILCDGTKINVTGKDGEPIQSSILISTPAAVYLLQDTDANGILIVAYGQVPCGSKGISVLANPFPAFRDKYAKKEVLMDFVCPSDCQQQPSCSTGQESINGACVAKCPSGQSRVNGQCAECTSDTQCANGFICKEYKCVQKETPPACTAPNCCKEDSECGQGSFCQYGAAAAIGKCAPIVCGQVENHQLVPYACGSETGCKQCDSPGVCEEHACHVYDVQCPASGTIGAAVICTLYKDGAPCSECNGSMTDPSGAVVPFSTDADGRFSFTPKSSGKYSVKSTSDPLAESDVQVQQPSSTSGVPQGGANGGTGTGGNNMLLIWIVILLIILIGAGIVWWLMKGKK